MESHPPILFKKRRWLAIMEILFVGTLLVLWFTDASLRESKNLWILFFYSFPSMFLIAIVPHEPVLFYFSKFHSPILVTFVALAGTLITEFINYNFFSTFIDLSFFQKIKKTRVISYLINLFNKAPFLALLVAGFTPVPFYPLRFLVVFASYPLWKYLLALFLSRTPRFFILAKMGRAISIPDLVLILFFVFISILINLPVIKNTWQNSKKRTISETNSPLGRESRTFSFFLRRNKLS
jgi:membrane protein YqaA with SNARE-associated domain